MPKRYQLNPESKPASADTGTRIRAAVTPQAEDLLALADKLSTARARRSQFLSSDLFAEPAWEMLLALYRVDAQGQRMTVSNMCRASEGPSTTALRWIDKLLELGMVTRHKNPLDARVMFVELTSDTRSQLQNYLTETWVALFATP